uniref:OCIA domain-containing protein n=1 Tax=Electrophorus electricus TaxID=8005 RepID=A0A4W4GNW1_ELEEL
MSSIWRERNEESFWYRALPLSLGSMAVTAGLIYNGTYCHLLETLCLCFASYIGACKEKFQRLGPEFSKDIHSGWCPVYGPLWFGTCRQR